jgi:hypothetical protein
MAIRDEIKSSMKSAAKDAAVAAEKAASAMSSRWTSPNCDTAIEALQEALVACGRYKGLEDAETIVSDSSIVEDVDAAEEDE